jgi:hypothetical protein
MDTNDKSMKYPGVGDGQEIKVDRYCSRKDDFEILPGSEQRIRFQPRRPSPLALAPSPGVTKLLRTSPPLFTLTPPAGSRLVERTAQTIICLSTHTRPSRHHSHGLERHPQPGEQPQRLRHQGWGA